MISVAIQGGAMRSIYCLGAVRALVDNGLATQVDAIHTTSAGCVAGSILAGVICELEAADSIPATRDMLLDRLAGDRFIDLKRLRRIVDVDFLVDTMRAVTHISPATLIAHNLTFEVAMTHARTGVANYVDLSAAKAESDLYTALRATMAIPLLYPRSVRIGGVRYVDGGISDPLPVVRALRRNPDVIVAISSVAHGHLGHELEGHEATYVRFMPGLSGNIRRQLLIRNPLAVATESLVDAGEAGSTRIIRITPADQTKLGSRLETDPEKLLLLDEMGYNDGLKALANDPLLADRATALNEADDNDNAPALSQST